jgi:hypothetical protein
MRSPGHAVSKIHSGEAMNDLSSEYLLEVYRTNVSIFFSLATEAFEVARKLADLNLQAGRIMLAESAA